LSAGLRVLIDRSVRVFGQQISANKGLGSRRFAFGTAHSACESRAQFANPRLRHDQEPQPMREFHRRMRQSSDTVQTRFKMEKTAFVSTAETKASIEKDYPREPIPMMAELCPKADKIRTFV
jgi:hypothetical protein